MWPSRHLLARAGILGIVNATQQIQEIVGNRLLGDIIVHAAEFAPDGPLTRPYRAGFFVRLFLVRHGVIPLHKDEHSSGVTFPPVSRPTRSKRPLTGKVPTRQGTFLAGGNSQLALFLTPKEPFHEHDANPCAA